MGKIYHKKEGTIETWLVKQEDWESLEKQKQKKNWEYSIGESKCETRGTIYLNSIHFKVIENIEPVVKSRVNYLFNVVDDNDDDVAGIQKRQSKR